MTKHPHLSRRSFLRAAAAAPVAFAAGKNPPIGIELYSVRGEMDKDTLGTVRAIAKIGYQVVEFYGPYYQWTTGFARDVRKVMDDGGIRCNSTHNSGGQSFSDAGIGKAIDLNKILGAKYVVMASAGNVKGLDGWKGVAETLTRAMEKFRPAGLSSGYHNHQAEFRPVEGRRPIEIIAAGTPTDFMLQLDVGTCVEVGEDPVAWIQANPGRIKSMHLKDWAKPVEGDQEKGYRVLFGEGDAQWGKIFDAAETVGGAEYYLIEQEGSRYPELETAERCLAAYKRMRGA
ncbi:MAG TPA: sugar phosphate isomerase/epimerase [Candidatus Acidoferrales bacterium]|nr:sugar phosphate isomerase/epimerase [Candidatus Acidoferrales bacterium]